MEDDAPKDAKPKVSLKGVDRIRVVEHMRQPVGFWMSEAHLVHDEVAGEAKAAAELASLQAVVRELLWEYAREVTLVPEDLAAFKSRLEFVGRKSPVEFSFWAAKQLKAPLGESAPGRALLQQLLEMRCTKTRLEALSRQIGALLKEQQFKIPFELLVAAGANPKPRPEADKKVSVLE